MYAQYGYKHNAMCDYILIKSMLIESGSSCGQTESGLNANQSISHYCVFQVACEMQQQNTIMCTFHMTI